MTPNLSSHTSDQTSNFRSTDCKSKVNPTLTPGIRARDTCMINELALCHFSLLQSLRRPKSRSLSQCLISYFSRPRISKSCNARTVHEHEVQFYEGSCPTGESKKRKKQYGDRKFYLKLFLQGFPTQKTIQGHNSISTYC